MSINKKLFVLGLTLTLSFGLSNLKAQTDDEYAINTITLGMPEVCLLESNVSTVNLTLTPTTAGNAVVSSVSDSTARVLISSVVSETETRRMTARITNGTVPSGTQLQLLAKAPVSGNFVGTAGSYSSTVILDATTENPIITGIGTCYSGTAENDGYVMKYTYGLPSSTTDYASIRATSGVAITVTLTLTNDM